MPNIRIGIFLILSLALHVVILAAAVFFPSKPVITESEPIKVAIVESYRDPGAGKNNGVESSRREAEKVEKKEAPNPKKDAVKPVAKEKRKPEKEIVSQAEPAPIKEAVDTGQSSEQPISSGFISSGLSNEGNELVESSKGSGVEVGYPDYSVNPKPDYPMMARRNGFEGLVLLKVLVLETGRVGQIELQKSSGYDALDKSALKAVRDWVFIPGKRNGEPVSSWVTVPIRFQLSTG